MTNNELLLNISGLLDKKLSPVNDKLKQIENCIESNIVPRLDSLEGTLNDNVVPRLDSLEGTLNDNVVPRLDSLEDTLNNNLSPNIKRINLTLENSISPRLQNIEACYVSTYKRYQSGVDQFDAMDVDIQIMKSVLREHSEKLQKIS